MRLNRSIGSPTHFPGVALVSNRHERGFWPEPEFGSRGEHLYCIQDTAAAIQNLLLAVVALGLGACWVGAFEENRVREVLNIPKELRPIAIIPVGWRAEKPRLRSKRPLHDIVIQEGF